MPSGVYKHKKHSKETRRKISRTTKQRHQRGEKFGFQKGHLVSEKIRKKISKANRGKTYEKICRICSKKFRVLPCRKNAKFCSKKCNSINLKGKKHPWMKGGKEATNWKGGKYKNSDGYWLIYKQDHPRSIFFGKTGYVKQAVLVLEKKLGRYLKPNEVSHHINLKKDDDRPENLQAMTKSKHMSHHCNLQILVKKQRRC